MIRESFNHQIKHLFAMQYSTAELRHLALEDVLAGPERLHADLLTKLPELQAKRKQYTDAQTSADPDAFPPVRREKPPKRGQDPTTPKGRIGQLVAAATSSVRQALPTREMAQRHPEAWLAAMDAKWWMIAQFDSAVVSMPDGTSASWYQRDPDEFQDLLKRTFEIHARLYREWPTLARRYRQAAARHRLHRPVVQDVRAGLVRRRTVVTTQTGRRAPRARRARERPAGVTLRRRRPDRRLPAPLPAQADRAARRSRRATRGRCWACCGPTCSPLVRFCMYFFVIGLVLGLHKDVPNFAIHMFAGMVGRALLHRDVLRRHPVDHAQQGDREEDGDAPGDVPGGLGDRLRVPHVPAGADPLHRRLVVGWTPDPGASSPRSSAWRSSPCCGTALALLFSAMNVFFRDFQNIVATLQLFTHWIVPMIYPFSKIAESAIAGTWLYYFTSRTR